MTAQARPRRLAIQELQGSDSTIALKSRSFVPDGAIPSTHADYGEKISPNLSWTGAPMSARSLVLLVEDPDARQPTPFVHWVLYNLPASVTSVPEAVPGSPRLPELGGALQGRNSRGTIGYFGPRPPKDDPPHHYHFQILALDDRLDVEPGVDAETLLATIKDRVVAHGELVGVYTAP